MVRDRCKTKQDHLSKITGPPTLQTHRVGRTCVSALLFVDPVFVSVLINFFYCTQGCGAEIIQRQRSCVCKMLGKQRAVFHSPHLQKETTKEAMILDRF
jgi:hypothetical protein